MGNVWKLVLCGDAKDDDLKENTQKLLKQREANDFKLLLSGDIISRNSFMGKAHFTEHLLPLQSHSEAVMCGARGAPPRSHAWNVLCIPAVHLP